MAFITAAAAKTLAQVTPFVIEGIVALATLFKSSKKEEQAIANEESFDKSQANVEDIEKISGNELNLSFLNHKKELLNYGYEAKKISMKNKDIVFIRKSY